MTPFNHLHSGIKTTNLVLSEKEIRDITDNIRTDASNCGLVSTVNPNVSKSEAYTPGMWEDTYYDKLFNKIDNVVNPDNKYKFKKDEAWLMRYTGSQNTDPHKHKGWDMVAIYYISAPRGSGVLYFTKLNIEIQPSTGLLVTHDGKLNHGVRANTIEGIERFCAVINYRYKR